MKNDKPILVAGATGYVGGRLIPGLLEAIAKVIGKPIAYGPERFTPRLHGSCALPS
jgi:nucleoside-diphosphate-sugar epimerase